ncbi:MAG: terminase [Dehalococcoidia bacterium]|nr:MAG: terminase [Dehalococcoidia bacterium]
MNDDGEFPEYGDDDQLLCPEDGEPLTPATSYGFAVILFARHVLKHPLDPWEEWVAIHLGELLPDGRPRFRKYLILVARQNGKTELLVVLTLYWMFVTRVGVVLGTSTKLDYAAESWRKACKLARRIPELNAEIPKRGGIRKANGEQVLWRADPLEAELEEGSRYKIAASNEEGGRSLTIDRLVLDELRQHHDYSAWDASYDAMSAVPDAQAIMITNAGSDKSVVLNDTRDEALRFIDTGVGDERLGLAEYSSPDGASPVDIDALLQANPNAGRRILVEDLLNEGAAAMRIGGKKLAGFRTERMCQRVPAMDNALDLDAWEREFDPAQLIPLGVRHPSIRPGCLDPGDLSAVRSRVTLCVEVSEDGLHATLYAAALLDDGRVRIDPVTAWAGPGCTKDLQADLPSWVAKVKPRKVGWLPSGPAAAVAASIAKKRDNWPPRGVALEEITRDTPAVCMGFAEQVTTGQVAHSGDSLLDAQVATAEKQFTGKRWVFALGDDHVDAVYAAAGAVHLARTLPPATQPRLRMIT